MNLDVTMLVLLVLGVAGKEKICKTTLKKRIPAWQFQMVK